MPVLHMQTEAVRAAGQQINQTSESLRQQAQQLRGRAQQLANEWQGPSASMFEQEMQTLLQRALQSAEAGGALNQKVQKEVDDWERVAAGLGAGSIASLIHKHIHNIVGKIINSDGNGNLPDKHDENLAGLSLEERAYYVFTEDYMKDMIGKTYQGANTEALNKAMEEFFTYHQQFDPPPNNKKIPYPPTDTNLINLLGTLADLRGVEPPEKFLEQYKTYAELYEQQPPKDKPKINLNKHPDFLGKDYSLRYGQVVGDVYGIDPIFGSLLNPTGGLVGPGSESYEAAEGDRLGYHGVFHDAGGHLLNSYGLGPGYSYYSDQNGPYTKGAIRTHEDLFLFWAKQPGLDTDWKPVPGMALDYGVTEGKKFVDKTATDIGFAVINTTGKVVSTVSDGANFIENKSQEAVQKVFSWF